MSSPTATNSSISQRQTYWCHECDMSVTLLSSATSTAASSPLLCPHCHIDFLEEMDSPLPENSDHQSPRNYNVTSNAQLEGSYILEPTVNGDDNFLLDSPYFRRLIRHLNSSDISGSSASSQASIESIPTLQISSSMLASDPLLLCAVCKDQFLLDETARQLPCKHLYHSDCILPWLSNHNSCPVCRFRLPTVAEEDDQDLDDDAFKTSRRMRLSELVMVEQDDDEWLGIGSTLRHIARRHRMLFPSLRHHSTITNNNGGDAAGVGPSGLASLLPTQMGEEETVSHRMRTSSVDAVSSWPVEGNGEGDIRVALSPRGNEEGESLMSHITPCTDIN